jgi:hypothetical protein
MFRTFLLLIVLVAIWLFDRHALSQYDTSYFTACMVLIFPFLVISLIINTLQTSGWVSSNQISNVKAIAFSLFIGFVVFEGILRIAKINCTYVERIGQNTYQSPYWTDKVNSFWHLYPPHDTMSYSRGEFLSYRISNSLGLSEREADLNDTTIKKILCLGDSFTEGIGTSADSSWPGVVEHYFNTCSKDSFLVYNAGVAGADPIYNYHLLRYKLWDIKWDAVVFCVNGTDIPEVLIRGGVERFKTDTVNFNQGPAWEGLYAASFLVRYFLLDIAGYNWTFHKNSAMHSLNMAAAGNLRNVLLQAHDELSRRGIKMMVVFHPMVYDILKRQYSEEGIDTLLKSIAPVNPVNLLPYYLDTIGINEKNYSTYYWPRDGHFKGIGYNIMGRKVAGELMSKMGLQCNQYH